MSNVKDTPISCSNSNKSVAESKEKNNKKKLYYCVTLHLCKSTSVSVHVLATSQADAKQTAEDAYYGDSEFMNSVNNQALDDLEMYELDMSYASAPYEGVDEPSPYILVIPNPNTDAREVN